MASLQSLIFSITGNTTGLTNALNQSGQALNQFGQQTGGVLGQLSSSFNELQHRFGTTGTGLVGLAAGAGIAVGGILELVNQSNEYAKQLNEVSKASGVSVEELQKLSKAFQGVGLDVEKFGDLNRDVLDHLGDSFRDGSGPLADMKANGLDIKEYNKYLNQTDGGIQALVHTFYQLQAAGKNTAVITNLLETMGSDGSKLISTMKKFSTEQDLWNNVNSQTASLSNENAKAYQKYDNAISNFSTTAKGTLANTLTPIVVALTDMGEGISTVSLLMDSFSTEKSQQQIDALKDKYGGLVDIVHTFVDLNNQVKNWSNTFQESQITVGEWGYKMGANSIYTPEYAQKMRDQIKASQDEANSDAPQENKTNGATPTGGWVDTGKVEAAAKAAAGKVLQARKDLDTAMSQIGIDSAAVQITQFNYQQDAITKKIQDSAKTIKLSAQETSEYLSKQNQSRVAKFKEMTDQMLSVSDPKQLQSNLAAINTAITPEQGQKMIMDQNKRVGINQPDASNPFDSRNLDDSLKSNQKEMNDEMILNHQLLDDKTQSLTVYLQRKQQLETAYGDKSIALQRANTMAQMSMMSTAAGDLGTTLEGAFGKSNTAAKAAFALSKGIAIAQAIVNIQQGMAKAWSLGWPLGISAAAGVLSSTASIVSTIKGTSISGQAHSGIDEVPGSGNSTWVLQGGERVIKKDQNQDLTKYLKQNTGSTGATHNYEISAPLVVSGGSNIDDSKKFQAMLDQHKTNVLQAVRSAQSRNS
ncbi:hypothetical protein SC206_19080 [Rouxiella sp. T17]|uniref:hypothetical protein n=1 Tax=Rouxiella sp. T17 TaxID=3085684 RepID=UPI002FC88440